jgi:hypothetical protein
VKAKEKGKNMEARYKEDELTPVPFEEAQQIMSAGLESLTGAVPKPAVLALALAKVTLESGRTGMLLFSSGHCSNYGNIKASPDFQGMYTLYKCNEVLRNKVTWFVPEGELDRKGGSIVGEKYALPPDGFGHPQCRFRAYANPTDGLFQYLDFIFRERYRDARDALLTGNPYGYVHALKNAGYFTADEAVYARGVAGLHSEFLSRIQGHAGPEAHVPDVSELVLAQDFNLEQAKASLTAAQAARRYQIEEETTEGFLKEVSGNDTPGETGGNVA